MGGAGRGRGGLFRKIDFPTEVDYREGCKREEDFEEL